MRYFFLTVILFLLPIPARAQVAGEPCQKPSQAIVADDKKSVLACLRRAPRDDGSSPMVWTLIPGTPKDWQLNGDAGADAFYKIDPEQKAR